MLSEAGLVQFTVKKQEGWREIRRNGEGRLLKWRNIGQITLPLLDVHSDCLDNVKLISVCGWICFPGFLTDGLGEQTSVVRNDF